MMGGIPGALEQYPAETNCVSKSGNETISLLSMGVGEAQGKRENSILGRFSDNVKVMNYIKSRPVSIFFSFIVFIITII